VSLFFGLRAKPADQKKMNTKRAWDDALAVFVGADDMGSSDVKSGVDMARKCDDPEAKWLCAHADACPKGTPMWVWFETKGEETCPTPGMALWIAAVMTENGALLKRSIELGYIRAKAHALCIPSQIMDSTETFKHLLDAATHNDRHALCTVSKLVLNKSVKLSLSDRDTTQGAEMMIASAQMGHCETMAFFLKLSDPTDPDRRNVVPPPIQAQFAFDLIHLKRSGGAGWRHFTKVTEKYFVERDVSFKDQIIVLGREFVNAKTEIISEKSECNCGKDHGPSYAIFRTTALTETMADRVKLCMEIYTKNLESVCAAMNAWVCVARRLPATCRDTRKLVAQIIWEGRNGPFMPEEPAEPAPQKKHKK